MAAKKTSSKTTAAQTREESDGAASDTGESVEDSVTEMTESTIERAEIPKRPKARYPTTKDFKAMDVMKFEGEEQSPGHYGLEDWVLAIDQAINDHKKLENTVWNEDQIRQCYRHHLTGRAKKWYARTFRIEAPSLGELQQGLTSVYGRRQTIPAITRRIEDLEKETDWSYEQYAQELVRICNIAPDPKQEFIMEFVCRAFARNVSSIHEALLSTMIPQDGPYDMALLQLLTNRISGLMDGSTGVGTSGRSSQRKADAIPKLMYTSGQAASSGRFEGKCYHCGKMGHRRSECRSLKREQQQAKHGGQKRAHDDDPRIASIHKAMKAQDVQIRRLIQLSEGSAHDADEPDFQLRDA